MHQNYGMSQIEKNVLSKDKKMHLPHCYRWCSIEPKKQLMTEMKYEGECIKNMELL